MKIMTPGGGMPQSPQSNSTFEAAAGPTHQWERGAYERSKDSVPFRAAMLK
jgi:hypothetical protein